MTLGIRLPVILLEESPGIEPAELPDLSGYWKGASDDDQRKARQLIVDFMAEAAGGPAFYTGRDMFTSPKGMHISAYDWEVFLLHSRATLEHFDVPARESDEVLSFFSSLKDKIIES